MDEAQTVFLRDVDGTGSLHPCSEEDEGAIEFCRVDYAKLVVFTDLRERPSSVARAMVKKEIARPAWADIARIYSGELAGSLASVTLAGMQTCIDEIQRERRDNLELTPGEVDGLTRATKLIAKMIQHAKTEITGNPAEAGSAEEAGQGRSGRHEGAQEADQPGR